ncbi:hypothetical protein MSAN_00502700 [Mycena sanguinolenta]|uniref:1,3-beta-glucanosyltransferase n=1 Tax=Mycena sanguinolenta TaxID=230812 RepID=A0A8H7DIV6_9AGAR|nr:hypothetical protein MSAN_00502700 [Mycena sanguinolenta]
MQWHGISITVIQLVLAQSIQALSARLSELKNIDRALILTQVLLPLYVDHGTNCTTWSPVFAAISAHPSTTFYIIISPRSGPGDNGTQPDGDFISCVLRLKPSGSQTVLLGWVGAITPSTGSVLGDIATYGGWDSSYRPSGIYLVDVTPTEGVISTYQSYISHATSIGLNFIALDTYEATSESYLDMVDFVNTYEDSYSSFDPSSLSGTLSKQSVTLKSAPSTGSYTGVISQLHTLGIKAVYITDVSDIALSLPVQLSEFVDEVASAGGSSPESLPGSTTSPASGSTPPSSPASRSATSPGNSNPSSPSKVNSSTFSASLSNSIMTTSSPSSEGTSGQKIASGGHRGSPVAAIVGGVLGALLFLSVLLSIFLCMRMRQRRRASGNSTSFGGHTLPHRYS